MRDSNDRQYTKEWLQYERQQPMYDSSIDDFFAKVFQIAPSKTLEDDFKEAVTEWVKGHGILGLNNFPIRDIIQGCTHYIDDLYQRYGDLHIFKNDYKYHWRLNNDKVWTTIHTLTPDKPLLIACPFPYYGDIHPAMYSILDECERKGIPVHVDGAWLGCTRIFEFDLNHPAIQSYGISLSKAGIGNNRIGIRFSREEQTGPITLMNKFNMNQQPLVLVGYHFVNKFKPGHWWNKYGEQHKKVCKDFDLTPTEAIHLCTDKEGKPVGIRPLLRAL